MKTVPGRLLLPLLLLFVVLSAPVMPAQTAKQKGASRKKATPVVAHRPALPGQQACEGALEVVPRTELSFTRKRYPAPRAEPVPATPGGKQN